MTRCQCWSMSASSSPTKRTTRQQWLRADPQSCESRSTNWPCEPAEHETDHRKTEEGSDGPGIAFEVAGEAAIAAGPGEGALDHPPLGHDDEVDGHRRA